MGKSQTPIETLGLGSRAEKALRKLGIATVGKLLELDASKVLGLPGCGHGVYQRLISAQKRLHVEQAGNSSRVKRAASTYQILRFSTGSWAQRCLTELGVKNLHDLAAVSLPVKRRLDLDNSARPSIGTPDHVVDSQSHGECLQPFLLRHAS